MAMAGLMKGHSGYSNSASRGRPYGMMLLLAFGAALIGVMVLHRFRERRIFNLLMKEKDSDLISLQLLLQKERDHVKDAKWKLEDMRAKIHTLRAHKKELDRRIMEMQSTVTSLREEQKTIESALEEKENEIKMLRDKNTHIDSENQRVRALSEANRHKESKNEDLKHQHEAPVNVWSVSTDDPSNTSVNSQMKTRMTERDEISVNQGKQFSGEMRVSTNQEAGENLTEHAESSRGESGNNSNEEAAKQGDFRRENGGETAESREITEEQSQEQGHSIQSNTGQGIIQSEGKKSYKSQNKEQSKEQDHSIESNTEERIIEGEGKKSGKSLSRGEELGSAKKEPVGYYHGEEQRPRDATNEGHTSGDEVTETTGDGALVSNAQGADNQEHGANLRGGGIQSQILVNSRIGRLGRKANNLKRAKGKRWTNMTRSKAGNSQNNAVTVTGGKTSVDSTAAETVDNSEPQKKGSGARNENGSEDSVQKIPDSLEKGEASARNTASYQQMEERERTNVTSITEMAHNPLKDALSNMTLQIDDNKGSPDERSIRETGQSEKEATGIQQQEEEIDRKKEDEVSEQSQTSKFDEETNNPGIEDFQEQETETETSREFTSNTKADGEERKGKNDDLEY